MEARLHLFFFFLVRARPRPSRKTITEHQLLHWAGPGPKSVRITQHKHPTTTVGATLVQLIYYGVLLGSAITVTTDCPPQTWCLVVLKKHRWLWMRTSHLLLKCWMIRFCSQKDYAIYTSQWKKSPSRKKALSSNMYLFSFSGFYPSCCGRWFILFCNMIKQNLITPSNILRQEWTATLDIKVLCLERSRLSLELF